MNIIVLLLELIWIEPNTKYSLTEALESCIGQSYVREWPVFAYIDLLQTEVREGALYTPPDGTWKDIQHYLGHFYSS